MARDFGVTTLGTLDNGNDIFYGIHENDEMNCTIAEGLNLTRGTCLAMKTSGTTVEVTAGSVVGTGNGTITLADPAYGTGVKAGVYKIVFIEGATNGGKFQVEFPDGKIEGTGAVGTAYNKTIKFTIADGSTDFVAGDTIDVTVAIEAGDGLYRVWDTNATDGTEILRGILGVDTDATSGNEKAFMFWKGKFKINALTATRTISEGIYNNGHIVLRGEL